MTKQLFLSLLALVAIVTGARAQDMVSTPLTFEATSNGDITFSVAYEYNHPVVLTPVEYKINDGSWTTYASWPADAASITSSTGNWPVTYGDAIHVTAGDKVAFRGNNASYYGNGTGFESHVTSTADVYVYGNVMSLIDATNFSTLKTLTGSWNFGKFFCVGTNYETWSPIVNTTIKNHPTQDIVLPATTITPAVYYGMFAGCKGLTRAPELPATTLEAQCYAEMFRSTGLTKAPALPATEMRDWYYNTDEDHSDGTMDCYMSMFQDCTELTEAPELPATTIVHGVYQSMFSGCVSLQKAPVLPAAKVADGAYYRMFYGCTSLNYVKCLATELLIDPRVGNTAEDNVREWLEGVSSTGTFVKADGMTSWQTGGNGIPSGWTVINAGDEVASMTETPLTIEATEDATIVTFTNPLTLTIEYSTDGGTSWTAVSDATITISGINAGQTVQLRGNNAAYGTNANYSNINFDKDCYVYGNIMSLVNADNFATVTELTEPYAFRTFFYGNTHLKSHSAKDLMLPATTLSLRCYYSMFYGCSALTKAPALPATALADYCYDSMFAHCYTLAQAPELPATTLAQGCYRAMFLRCEALATAPVLPAMTMARNCYLGMFYRTALAQAPALPATTLAYGCYYQMFQNCKSLTVSPALPAATAEEMCYQQMFQGCENLETAGDLSATTMGLMSCNYMFSGCTKLTKAPALPATTLATQCYQRMFEECHSLVDAPALPATELAELCYNDMFWNCTSLKNAPVLAAETLVPYCYTMMFFGCSSLEKAPDLPAAKLEGNCYEHMFMNCTSLNYVKCLATDLGDETTTDGWLTNVAATGTFVKAESADWSGKGTTEGTDFDDPNKPMTFVHGIPEGWAVENASAVALGDVNGDGVVGIADIVAVTNVMAGTTTDAATVSRADVNGDNAVGIADIVAITNIMAGN